MIVHIIHHVIFKGVTKITETVTNYKKFDHSSIHIKQYIYNDVLTIFYLSIRCHETKRLIK